MEHGGKQKVYDFGTWRRGSKKIYYAAHFSDVQHEVERVFEGYRCVLVYNLCKNDSGIPVCSPSTFSSQVTELLINEWRSEPNALIFPLNHMYSYTGFLRGNRLSGASSLKGYDAFLAAALEQARENFQGDDELSFYIGNATKLSGIWGGYDADVRMFEGATVVEPIPYYSKPHSIKSMPKYLRETSPKYKNDFHHTPIEDLITFDGTQVKYPECYNFNFTDCLVAHELDSMNFWAHSKLKQLPFLGNEGPGIRQIFYHTVLVVVKKLTEKELLYQNGSFEHVTDFILKQKGQPQFKQYFVDRMKWLIENWSEKERLVRAPEDTFEDYWFDAECKIVWSCIDMIFQTIAELKLFDLVEELVDKMIKSRYGCKVGHSKGSFFSCIGKLPSEVERRVVLKMIAVETQHSGGIFCRIRSDIDAWLNHLELMATRTSEKADFRLFCEAVAEVMKANIAYIEKSDSVIKAIKRYSRLLPIIAQAYPYRLVTLKSVLKACFRWVHFIREFAVAQVAEISLLVDAALPGISKNVITQPDDVKEFIKLLYETKPQFDIGEFTKEVVGIRSSSGDCVQLIELLSKEGLGNTKDLCETALPDFIANVEKKFPSQIMGVLKMSSKIRSNSDVQQIAIDIFKRKAISNAMFLGSPECITLLQKMDEERVADIHSLVLFALPGIIKNVKSMQYKTKSDMITILLKEKMLPELKEFAVAVADNSDGKELESILIACKSHLGDAYLKQEGLQPIIIARAMWLEEQLKEPLLQFTWCMPEAHYLRDPEIEKFLRGPEETFYYHIYDSMKDIKIFIHLFNERRRYQFSAKAAVDRQGSKPRVVIKKTRGLHEEKIATRKKYSEELTQLRGDTGS